MAAVNSVVIRGFGNGTLAGTIALVVLRGYTQVAWKGETPAAAGTWTEEGSAAAGTWTEEGAAAAESWTKESGL